MPSSKNAFVTGLANKLVKFVVKHPVIAVGGGVAATQAVPYAGKLNASIRSNRMGLPTAKYSSADSLGEFEERKAYLNEKLAFEKVAFNYYTGPQSGYDKLQKYPPPPGASKDFRAPQNDPNIAMLQTKRFGDINMGSVAQAVGGDVVRGVATGVTEAGLQGIGRMLGGAARSIKERLVLNKKREKIVDEITENDPYVSVFEQESPGSTIKAYSTMVRTAPTLSLDPNVATAFLRNSAQTGGVMDFATIKLLADAESAVNHATGKD